MMFFSPLLALQVDFAGTCIAQVAFALMKLSQFDADASQSDQKESSWKLIFSYKWLLGLLCLGAGSTAHARK